MKFVISTNTIINYLCWEDSVPNQAVDAALHKGWVVHSDASALLLEKILMDSKFDKYLSRETRQEFLRLFKEVSEHVMIRERIKVCQDIKDNIIMELAFNAPADYVISSEQDILQHDRFVESIRVVTPGTFLQEVEPAAEKESSMG